MRLRNFLAATAVSTLALGALGVPAHANTAPDPARAGAVVAWGDPDDANAGPETYTVPLDLTGPVTAISANTRATAAVTADGGLRVWGKGDEVAEAPAGVTDAIGAVLTVQHGAVLHADGTISTWGPGDALDDVPSDLRAKAIALQGNVGYAVRPNGTLATWGGELATPLPTTGLTDLVDVSASLSHVLALKADGTILSWGAPAPGLNDIPDFGGKKVVKVVAGYLYSAVILEDGTIDVWGFLPPAGEPSFDGLTPAGKVIDVSLAPLSAGASAVTADGVVHTWGAPEDVAAVPPSLTGEPVSSIALGQSHAVVIVTTFRKLAEQTISGTPAVGQTISVTPPQYSLAPDSSTGQWFTNAGPIAGETGSTLALTDAMVGAQVHYETSATRDGVTLESSTPTVTVAKATTTTTLTVTPAAAAAGRALVATAAVTRSGGTPAGTVTFKVGTTTRIVPLAGGKASWTLPTQAAGSRAVTASYAGSPSSAASSAAPVTIKITKAASKVRAKAKSNHGAKKVTLTITVTRPAGVNPAGKVTITLQGKTKKTVSVRVNANGKAVITVKKLKAGKYTAKLKYVGNGNVAGSNGSVKFKI